jgi:hypothetical protein
MVSFKTSSRTLKSQVNTVNSERPNVASDKTEYWLLTSPAKDMVWAKRRGQSGNGTAVWVNLESRRAREILAGILRVAYARGITFSLKFDETMIKAVGPRDVALDADLEWVLDNMIQRGLSASTLEKVHVILERLEAMPVIDRHTGRPNTENDLSYDEDPF